MNICFVTSEFAPYAKVGGLADVSSALPAALHRAGHKVRLIVPYYRDLKVSEELTEPIEELANITIDAGPEKLTFHGYRCPYPQTQDPADGPELILIKCDELFDRKGIYGDSSDEFLRFLLLSRAGIEICQRFQWAPDIFHCNDWQTALIPLLLRSVYDWDGLFNDSRTVLTIHNLAYQGVFASQALDDLSLDGDAHP